MIIYCTTNLINGKKYIGKDAFNNPKYLGSGKHFKNAVKKYGRENFKKQTLQDCISIDDLNESEIYWIDYFGAVNSGLFYNIAYGGSTINLKGSKLTKEHSEKISESLIGNERLKGFRFSNESKEKMSKSRQEFLKDNPEFIKTISEKLKGMKKPEGFGEKISKSTKGKKFFSEETRKKMSEARKGKPLSEEVKTNMRKKVLSEEHKEKISKSLIGNKRTLGHKLSEETKLKISESVKKKKI